MKSIARAALLTLVATFVLASTTYAAPKRTRSTTAAAKCTGSSSCRACKNCRYCKHCAKDGGTCGVCRRGGEEAANHKPQTWKEAAAVTTSHSH